MPRLAPAIAVALALAGSTVATAASPVPIPGAGSGELAQADFGLDTELWPHGGVLGPPLTLGVACGSPVLAAAATGAQLLTGTCEQGNGNSVVTLFPGATLG